MEDEEGEHASLPLFVPTPSSSLELEQEDLVIAKTSRSRSLVPTILAVLASVLVLIAAVAAAFLFHQSTPSRNAGFHSSRVQDGVGFHFQPPRNSGIWMLDPAAAIFYSGYYHLFYRFLAADTNSSCWGHAISTDLLHWTHLSAALEPSEWYDERGIGSGSVTLLKSPVIVYTGTSRDGSSTQNAAVPDDPEDPLLKSWKKIHQNPLIPQLLGRSDFRAPSTAWRDYEGGPWRILLGSKNGSTGIGFVFQSKDFFGAWQRSKAPLLAVPGTGMWESLDFFPISGSKHVVKASLSAPGSFGFDAYAVGRYVAENATFLPDRSARALGFRYDHGNRFYASKTFADPSKNRRLLWGWIPEKSSSRGFAPSQSVPRKLWLASPSTDNRERKEEEEEEEEEEDTVMQLPMEEIASLRIQPGIHKTNLALDSGALLEIEAGRSSRLDVEVKFELPDLTTQMMSMENFDVEFRETGNAAAHCRKRGARVNGITGPFGLLVLATGDLAENTAIFFRLGRSRKGPVALVCADHSRSSLENSRRDDDDEGDLHGGFVHLVDPSVFGSSEAGEEIDLSLRVLVDDSVVETFAQGGKVSITSRVYPTRARGDAARLFVFNNGTNAAKLKRIDAWNMKGVEID